MHWEQLHADQVISADAIRRIASEVMGARVDVDSWGEGQVLVELSSQEGEFPQRIDVHLAEGFEVSNNGVLAQAIAAQASVRVLRDDGTVDPYRRLLVHPDGNEESVLLSDEALDENDALVISQPKETLSFVSEAPVKKDPVADLLDFYHDAALPNAENDEQRAALQRLYQAVSGQNAEELKNAVEQVRDLFSAEQLEQPFTTVETLLKAADLLARTD